jgi:Na+/proline symporter
MEFLLNLPPAISFFLVSAFTTLLSLAGLYFVRKKYPTEVLKDNHEVAAIIFNAFGLFYGVMVAFVVFVTWTGYDDATKNLQLEASEALDIFHSAEAFPEPTNKILRQGLRDYVASVYNDEIQKLARGQINLISGGAHSQMAMLFHQVDVQTIPNRELYAETLHCLNNLAEYRRLRIFAGNDTVPPVIWGVMLIGGLFTISYTFFLGMKNVKAQYIISSTLTITISLILLLIYVLDHPFTGPSKVSTEPLREVLDIMQKGETS